MLSYRGISKDLKYFAITQSLQNDVLTVFFLDCGGERLLQTEYLFAKACESFYNTVNICQTKQSTAQLGPSRPHKELFYIPFVAFTGLLKGAVERQKHRRRM